MRNLKFFLCVFYLIISSDVSAESHSRQIIDFPMSNGSKVVNLSFEGEVFTHENAEAIKLSSENPINSFVARVIAANISKQPNKILSLWAHSERDILSQAINKPSALERNASLYKNIQRSKLLGYIEYGDYVICYIEHLVNGMPQPYLKLYPLIVKGQDIFQTNQLSSDFFFSKVSYELGNYIWYK